MSKLTTLKSRPATLDTRRGAPAVKRIVGRTLQKIRDRILLRDEYTCRKCGRVTVDLEVDHIVPLHLGGRESDENRQCLCPTPCHSDKTEGEAKER